MIEEFKAGDKVEVELITHERGKSIRYSTWKPAIFEKYDGKRIWVSVKTPAGMMKRSFPASKVRKANEQGKI